MRKCAKIAMIGVLLVPFFYIARADERMYRCEFGIEGGCGYYVGDAAEHIFTNVREAYGANFRYRFDQRWCLQVKGLTQRIAGQYSNRGTDFADGKWTNQLVNLDVAAEFNFFRFGGRCYDRRVKPYSPFLVWGVGLALHGGMQRVAAYMPFGIGFKWQFAPRCNAQIRWQHNLYFADNIENVKELDNSYDLNGSNVLNCDLTGMLTVGVSFEFARDKKVCKMCKL
ncbi:MAG: hypothetical protein MJZ65_05190 [Paludibacteraceae bacterium]|nr:hypothetical protein [Paludibacteraceae bacterium]